MTEAKKYMNEPITISHSAKISDVLRKLLDSKKSRLLITDDKGITSIVSEKDVGMFLFNDKTERKLGEIPLSEISKKIISIKNSTSLEECAKTILENNIGSLALTSSGNVVGIITKTDLVKYFVDEHKGKKTVGEYMTPYYAWGYSDSPISKIVSKMIKEKISRVILRNENERPEGVITFRDLFYTSLNLGQQEDVLDNSDSLISVIFPRKGFISESGFGGSVRASEIMTKKILSVNYDDDLGRVGELLLENKINGAGVLSRNGNLIGIISKTDIVKALAFVA